MLPISSINKQMSFQKLLVYMGGYYIKRPVMLIYTQHSSYKQTKKNILTLKQEETNKETKIETSIYARRYRHIPAQVQSSATSNYGNTATIKNGSCSLPCILIKFSDGIVWRIKHVLNWENRNIRSSKPSSRKLNIIQASHNTQISIIASKS